MSKPNIIPVVTCMGRLRQLECTLPALVASFNCVVLVDYCCPDHCGDWAEAGHPTVRVVRIAGRSEWHKPYAINQGIQAARGLGAGWILCIDADTRIREGFREAIEALAVPGRFGIAPRSWPGPTSDPELCGLLLVSVADLERVGPFDEQFHGWGGDDIEMRCRLAILGGLLPLDLPHGVVNAIRHRDTERVKYTGETRQFWLQSHRRRLAECIRQWTGRDDWRCLPEVHALVCHPTLAAARRWTG